MKKIICIITLLTLTACSSTPTPVVIYPTLPESITSPCISPTSTIKTNGDLLNYTVELKGALSYCSAKQRALAEVISNNK